MVKRQKVSEQVEAINLLELEARAREVLPQMAYDYYASGANDEVTLRENRAAFERITLLPRMLVDVSARDLGTTVLGEPVSMPILIAPTAFQGLAHPEGEVATVKAAGAAKTLMTLSTLSTFSIEEVMTVATGPVWFQLYVFKDRAISASLVKHAHHRYTRLDGLDHRVDGGLYAGECSERIEIATSKLSVNALEAIGISHVGYAKGTTRNHPKT